MPRSPRCGRRAATIAVTSVLGLALLTGCAKDAPQDTWQPAGENAQKIQNLQWPVFLIAGIVLLLVFAAVGWAVFRYRDRGQPLPEQSHGKPALEIALTILPALILIGVAIPTVGTLMALSKTDDTECYVNVTGQQWWWEIDYPTQAGCGGITEPIVTSGQMIIPTGTNVLVRGTSRDVIHSWWIPRLNGKRDMVPGRVQTVRLEADEPGIYAGQCTEFCGLSHANMRMEVVALDAADFEAWKTNQLAEYEAPEADTLAATGEQTFIAQCSRCHQVDGLLDADGNPVISEPQLYVWSEAAPNLTNLMTRNTFAGATFSLLTEDCRAPVWNAAPDEFGPLYLEGVTRDCLNEVDLREWLRNAPEKKPMYTDPEELGPTDGKTRGMPYLALSEDQIDQLIAYLLERHSDTLMAIIERAIPATTTGPPAALVTPTTSLGVFRRPVSSTGWRSWLFTVDHKKLGIMYGVTAMVFFVVGGIEALFIRAQLAGPNGTVLSADLYNQMFTMHATSMVFLFAMPMAAAFGNYFLPLQVGARDVAFPRINAFGYWCFLFGALFINSSWLLGGAADGGWFMYAPNSSVAFSPTHGIDIWALGLMITGIASQTGAINLIVTVLNMRTKGMSLMRMPVFTWMVLVIQFLLLFAIPVITVALVLLIFQREFGATFFSVQAGADPLLWQHLFWIFGHPEVYILVLPSFGIVSEVLPVFSRKPLFGYPFVVFSGAAIGFVGWGVWAHHMFASGLGPVSVAVFSVATMAIAIPTGVKIVNWTLTMWGGKLWFTTAMLFAIGLVVEFTIGGLSGVTHSVAPSDTQQTDTYYIVAHFHYVLFGGAVLGFFAGFYYWWPKVFGKCLSEKLGKWNFWLMIIGMNMTFGPMHIIGLQGQPRRMYVWTELRAGEGFFNLAFWNLVSSIGAFILATGVLMFLINVVHTHRKEPKAPLDPWDARTLEWITTSPPKEHNFDALPTVHALDEFFHRKYEDVGEGDHHDLQRVATAEDIMAEQEAEADHHIHLPSPSYWPIILALSLPITAYGVIYNHLIGVVGAAILLLAGFGWSLEPSVADESDYDPPTTDADGPGTELATVGSA